MSLDIVVGDVLVLNGVVYPVIAVGDWTWEGAASPAMRRRMTTTYSVKRAPVVSGGRRGASAAHLASVTGTPLDSVSPTLAAELLGGDFRYVQMYETTVMDGEARYLRLFVERTVAQ